MPSKFISVIFLIFKTCIPGRFLYGFQVEALMLYSGSFFTVPAPLEIFFLPCVLPLLCSWSFLSMFGESWGLSNS